MADGRESHPINIRSEQVNQFDIVGPTTLQRVSALNALGKVTSLKRVRFRRVPYYLHSLAMTVSSLKCARNLLYVSNFDVPNDLLSASLPALTVPTDPIILI